MDAQGVWDYIDMMVLIFFSLDLFFSKCNTFISLDFMIEYQD